MKVTVNARDKRAPQRVTNEIIKIEMKAGVMNTTRSSVPPVYANSDFTCAETLCQQNGLSLVKGVRR